MSKQFDFVSTDGFNTPDLSMFPEVVDFEANKSLAAEDTNEENEVIEDKTPKTTKKTAVISDIDDFEAKIQKLESERKAKGEKVDLEVEEDEEDTTKSEVNSDTSTGKPSIFKTLGEEFSKKGLLTLPEDFDGTEEGFTNAFQSTLDSKFEEMVDEYTASLSERGKALLNHLENGGDPDDFVKVYSNSLDNIDLTNQEDRKKIMMRYHEEIAGTPKAKIQAKVEKLIEMGLDGDESEGEAFDNLERLKARDVENKLALENHTKATRKQEEEDRVATVNAVKEFIAKNDTIKGVLPIKDPKKKKEFEDYLLKPTVKLKSGQMVTRNVADAIAEQGDTETILFAAYNRWNKYDTKAIQKVGATKQVESLAEKLEASTKTFRTKNIEEDAPKKKSLISDWESAVSNSYR